MCRDLQLFSFATIIYFSIENKLGQGGFGPVFEVNLELALLIIDWIEVHSLDYVW